MTLEEIIEVLKKQPLQSQVLTRLVVLAYNAGDVLKTVYYALHYGDGLSDPAYRAEIVCALADAYTQIRVLLRFLGFDEEEIKRLGEKRLQEFLLTRMRK